MGAAFSCFQAGDADHQTRCLCFDFAVNPILRAWTTLFPGPYSASVPRDVVTPEQVMDDSSCDTYRPPPRPLSFDDPRCSYMISSGLISPRDKASIQLYETDRNSDESVAESLGSGEKIKDSDSVPLKQEPRELEYGLLFAFTFPEEDSCPICLEEYCSENPKMTLQCMHHFHLACIYEWMERSESCPICGKVMELDEKT